MNFISIRSITKRVNLCTYKGSIWCTYVLPLQPYRDITSVLFCRLILLSLSIFKCYKRNTQQPTHCWCDIHAPTRCSLTVIKHLYCLCRYLILFLTKFLRYRAEIKDNRHIIDAIYTCTFSSLIIDRVDINFMDI